MGTDALAAAHVVAAATKSSSSSSLSFLLIIVVVFGLLYFVMIRPQRNRQRQAQQPARVTGAQCTDDHVVGVAGVFHDDKPVGPTVQPRDDASLAAVGK